MHSFPRTTRHPHTNPLYETYVMNYEGLLGLLGQDNDHTYPTASHSPVGQ